MDTESLKLYIDICKCGSMSAAATHFFLTQSTVSKRMHALETEVGARLFERGKGERQIKLTQAGETFYGIAERMLMLYSRTLQLKETASRKTLTLACINSAQSYTLPPFLSSFRKEHPEIQFTLEDHHSVEIFQLLENRLVDFGVTHSKPPYPDLRFTLLYEEPYRIIMRAESECSKHSVHPGRLKPEHEVYQAFCDNLKAWRNRWFPPYCAKVRVNTTATGVHYLTEPDDWMIVPECIANRLAQQGFISCAIEADPPLHCAYLIWHKEEEDSSDSILPLLREKMREYFGG